MPELPRLAGALVPVFALRHETDLGIGDTAAVRDAISFCAEQEIGLLQLLPINEMGGDNSPYNAISSVALDPIYLHLDPDEIPGLRPETLETLAPKTLRDEWQRGPVDYRRARSVKLAILRVAFDRFEQDLPPETEPGRDFEVFQTKNESWLPAYTLFRTLVEVNGGSTVWTSWPAGHENVAAAGEWLAGHAQSHPEILLQRRFLAYLQWLAWRQWADVSAFAEQHQVLMVGDVPFGVSRYSSDVWAERDLFDLTWSGGAPPETVFAWGEFLRKWGQNWGLPLYRWDIHRAREFAWWKRRIAATTRIFHGFRIDHALGFFRIYRFPWLPHENDAYQDLEPEAAKKKAGGRVPHFHPRSDEAEADASANAAEGEALLRMIQEAAGTAMVVAEDLGVVPKYVPPLLEKLGMPGFSIPHFLVAPDAAELLPPGSMPETSIATWGTHDHASLIEWYADLVRRAQDPGADPARHELRRIMLYLGYERLAPPAELTEPLREALVRTILEARSCWAIFMIGDLLGIDLRFNQPGTTRDDNWTQRLGVPLTGYGRDPDFTPKLRTLREAIERTHRAPL